MPQAGTKKIAVIEDEPDILEVIRHNLSKDGFRVVTAKDGVEGLSLVTREAPDLIVLDLMLPRLDGIEVCRKLKADAVTQTIPVIMVTAKDTESDAVLGLGVGADDYVRKPFLPKELVARVRAVLRRGPDRSDAQPKDRVAREGLVIDSVRHEVRVDGRAVPFTATEFRLLHFLGSHPGRAFDRQQLVNRVVGEHALVIDRNIDVHVRSIRKKLGRHRDLIETLRGVGYRFRAPD